MEYESGEPLKRWLGLQKAFGQRELLALVHPVLDGLEAVHATGFLHRDIKPDNIYVRGDGSPVLLDFGAARRVSGNRDLTNIVSPGFAPFEQYHSHGNQGPWTDIYSLGAVMYWMATGRKPMESARPRQGGRHAGGRHRGRSHAF
jgi:serine/threonine protein kinase